MAEATVFLAHLRSVHFAMVVASVLIIMAITSANEQYSMALEQLDELIEQREAFSVSAITDQVRNQADSLGVFRDDDVLFDDFFENSFHEYFENVELPPVQLDHISMEEIIKKGLGDWIISDDINLEEVSFFYTHGALLNSTQENKYLLDYSYNLSTGTVEDIINSLNRLLALDALYHSPYFFSYYQENTLFNADGEAISSDVLSEAIERMREPSAYLTIIDVILTNQEDREAYARAEEAAQESPEAWFQESYTPDFIQTSISISDKALPYNQRSNSRVTLTANVPFFFVREDAQFIPSILRTNFPEQQYFARYDTGSRHFREIFPQLWERSQGLTTLGTKELRNYLDQQSRESSTPVSILGIEVRQSLIQIWGLLALLGIQLYFFLHLRAFKMINKGKAIEYPWIGIYSDPLSKTMFIASTALPVFTCIVMLWQQWHTTGRVLPSTIIFTVLAALFFLGIGMTRKAAKQ